MDLLVDIVFNSTYPEQEIEHEVDVICDEIESYNDSPAELIYDEFENLLFQGHPLGHNILGTRERVQTFTSLDAQRFTHRYYRPDNAIFFAYGDVDFSRLVRLLEKLSPKHSPSPILSSQFSAPISSADDANPSVPQPSTHHQSHVMIGCKTFSFTDERRWSVYFGCDHHDVRRCRQLVYRELDRLKQHPLSDRQLQAAKRQIKGQIAIACDNREQFALDFAKSFLHYDKERDIDYLFRQIDAITAQQLQDVAQTCFGALRELIL